MYELYRELEVKTTREKAWEFIRSLGNLNKITPDDLSFEIISDLPNKNQSDFLSFFIPFQANKTVKAQKGN